jgi:hypothetical protein
MLKFHRKEQCDLECKPIICVHRYDANCSQRVFCLWFWGVYAFGKVLDKSGVW